MIQNNWFEYYDNVHYHTRLSRRNDLIVPYARTNNLRQLVTYAGPSIWNSIPDDLKVIDSYDRFKISLKRYILSTQRLVLDYLIYINQSINLFYFITRT